MRRVLQDELQNHVNEWQRDALGNLIAVKPAASGPKVMLAAHMDECGLMISSIDSSGLLRFRKVGGLDDRVLVSKTALIGDKRVPGVIGAKAILPAAARRAQPGNTVSLAISILGEEEGRGCRHG